jgi:hypothetical protein
VIAGLVVALLAAPGVAAPDWSRPPTLPSLVTRWREEGKVCGLATQGGTVYVLRADGLGARSARTGRRLWTAPPDPDGCVHGGTMAATAGRVFVQRAGDVAVFDAATGAPVGAVGIGMSDLVALGDMVVGTFSESGQWVVAGVRAADLKEAWRLPGYYSPGTVGGALVATRDRTGGTGCEVVRVDAATGRVGGPLPEKETPGAVCNLPWDVDVVAGPDGTRVRRTSAATGKAVWTVRAPANTPAWARDRDAVYLHSGGEGRGVLTILDWRTGGVRGAAYGLRDVRHLAAADGTVFLGTDVALVAAAADTFGPPDAAATHADREVRSLLDTPFTEWDMGPAMLDLQAFVPEALPLLRQEASRREGRALRVLAHVLGRSGDPASAPVLAARLAGAPDQVAEEILKAVARIGGAAAVDAVAGVLADTRRKPTVRMEAFTTLASLGTPRAVDALEGAVAAGDRRVRWTPPSAVDLVDLIGQPIDEARREAAAARASEEEDFSEFVRLNRAERSGRLELPEGRVLLVFPHPRLGSDSDLWSATVETNGSVGPARFLGVSLPPPRQPDERLALHLEGDVLTVTRHGEPSVSVRADLAAAARDTDADGLPDLVEARIGTASAMPDTDGDGVPDGADPNPDRPPRGPTTEDEQIVDAIVRQYFLFDDEDGRRELLVVGSSYVLDWSGRLGPTLCGGEEGVRERGGRAVPVLSVGPAKPGARPEVARPVREDERLYHLSFHRGPLNGISYEVVVRRLRGRWYVRDLVATRVS